MRSSSGFRGAGAQLLDGRFIHAGGIEIADFLLDRRALRVVQREAFSRMLRRMMRFRSSSSLNAPQVD